VRGAGLLLGVDLERPVTDVVAECLEAGLLTTAAGPRTLRLTPPLVVTAAEVDEALAILGGVL
jgi:acetylornithine/succinyldiaminopimelate/putrescine aminotransferase